MSRLAVEYKSINLGQGFPDNYGPNAVLQKASEYLFDLPNQYPPMLGVPELRQAVAAHNKRFYGLDINWKTEISKVNHFDMNEDVIKSAALEFFCITGEIPDMKSTLFYPTSAILSFFVPECSARPHELHEPLWLTHLLTNSLGFGNSSVFRQLFSPKQLDPIASHIRYHFLDASSHLYMRSCPSVGRSVRPSVRPSVTRFSNAESEWFSV